MVAGPVQLVSGKDVLLGSTAPPISNLMTNVPQLRRLTDAGLHSVFSRVGESGLQIEYEGPGFTRQRIPDTALFREVNNATATCCWFPAQNKLTS